MHLPLTVPAGPAPAAGTSAGDPDLLQLVQTRRQDAVERLTAAAGDSSLCTLPRSGEPRPTVKYLEGTVAALSDVHHELRSSSDAPVPGPAASASLVGAARERWLARRGHSAASSSGWHAYLDGAVDALDELAGVVATHAGAAATDDGEGTPQPGAAIAQPAEATRDQPEAVSAPPTTGAREPALTLTTARLARESRWPRRRTIAAAMLAPALFAVLVATGGGWMPVLAPLWTMLVALTSIVGAATLSTYLPLPGQGWRPNMGCTPCASMSAMTVLGAAWFLGSAPLQPGMAAVALAAVSFGLVQRLTGAGTSCAT